MSGYDYGNARLRAMKSRLLPGRELESLVEAGSIKGLLAALTKTDYHRQVEAALARSRDFEALTNTLHDNLCATVERVRSFFSDDELEDIGLLLRTYDIDNLKAILRGLSQRSPAQEIAAALLPIGEIKLAILSELTRAPSVRAAIDMMASMRLPAARPLMQLRAVAPGASTAAMELALQRWHFQEALERLNEKGDGENSLLRSLEDDADMVNVLTVLRHVQARSQGHLAPGAMSSQVLMEHFVGPGNIALESLTRAISQSSLDAALQLLMETPLQETLRAGLQSFRQTGHLSDFERALRHHRMQWAASLIGKDALGIGVVIGYLALKANEVSNIRRIAQGIKLQLPKQAILDDLEYVA